MWMELALGTLLIACGYQLRYKHRYSLIAGYDPRRTKNPKPLARMLGGIAIAWGLWTVATTALAHLFPSAAPWDTVRIATLIGVIAAILIGSLRIKGQLQ